MNLRTLLYGTATALALATSANAATINVGVNPTSASGDFSNSVGGGAFVDFITFQLVGGPQFLTITSATNVYPRTSDFIAGFTGSVYEQVGAPGGGDDILQFGPQVTQACILVPSCQLLAGSGILDAGDYYLQLSGIGGGTSGYGGNLAVSEVPIPGALALFASGLVGLGALGGWRKKKNKALGTA
jgi:hypothetical protein